MAGNLVISQINGGPIGVINAIINGNFQVNQRGVSGTVTLAAGAYGHDRWKAGASGCTYTFATVNNVTTLTITAGSLIQVIEGINLYSGTYTLSWTGTAQGRINGGSYSGSGVTGTATGGTNLNIEFGTGTVSLVQFQPGTEASPFERRDYGRELMMCRRYCRVIRAGDSYSYFGPLAIFETSTNLQQPYPVDGMRTSALSWTVSGSFQGEEFGGILGVVGVGLRGSDWVRLNWSGSAAAGQVTAIRSNNDINAKITLDCEL